jgi:hypothetical protein
VYLRENPPRDKDVPGPGNYPIPSKIGKEGFSYTLRPRTTNQCI